MWIRTNKRDNYRVILRNFFNSNTTDFTKERVVYYSISLLMSMLFFMFFFLVFGIYLISDEHYFFGILLIFVSLYKLIFECKHLFLVNEQQLKINSLGIQVKKVVFYPWDKIEKEKIESVISGEDTNYYLTFDVIGSKDKIRILINDFNISPKDLDKLIRIHRYYYG